MDKIIEFSYILSLLISAACFTVHIVIKAKNLTSTSNMHKWRSTTYFLILAMTFNLCDFLIIFLDDISGPEGTTWLYVAENLLSVGIAYAMICVERDWGGGRNPRWLDMVFFAVAMCILYADSLYTLKHESENETAYVIIMAALNLVPMVLLIICGLRIRKHICATEDDDNIIDPCMVLYGLVCVILCVASTAGVVGLRTAHDFIVLGREFYVIFWLVFNGINLFLVWRSCVVDERDDVHRMQSPEEKLAGIMESFGLSQREREIAELLYQGKNNKEIAAALYLSPNTIKVHASNLYRKLGASNRVQAVQVLRGEEISPSEIKEE